MNPNLAAIINALRIGNFHPEYQLTKTPIVSLSFPHSKRSLSPEKDIATSSENEVALIIGAGILATAMDSHKRSLSEFVATLETQPGGAPFPANIALSDDERDDVLALYKIGQAVMRGQVNFDVLANFKEHPSQYFILNAIARNKQDPNRAQITEEKAISHLFDKAIAACSKTKDENEYKQRYRVALESFKAQTLKLYKKCYPFSFENCLFIAEQSRVLSVKIDMGKISLEDIESFNSATKKFRMKNKGFEMANSAFIGATYGVAIGMMSGLIIGGLISMATGLTAVLFPVMVAAVIGGLLVGLLVGIIAHAMKEEPPATSYGSHRMFCSKSPQLQMVDAAEKMVKSMSKNEETATICLSR